MWWRSWFLQAAWSYQFKQNLGFAAAYRRLRPGTRIRAARLLEPFNTNPVVLCFVLPFLASREDQGAGEDALLGARAFLASSFAAVGDRLVWFLMRPAAGLLGALVAWSSRSASAGALTLLIAYNAPQVALRSGLWRRGLAGGDPASEVTRVSRWAEATRRTGLVLLGFALVAVPARGAGMGPVGAALLLAAAAGTAVVLRLAPRLVTWWSLALLCALLALNRGMP